MRLLILFSLAACLGASDPSLYGNVVNTDVARVLDLRTHTAEESVSIKFRNEGRQSIDTYFFAIPSMLSPNLAFIQGHAGKRRLPTVRLPVACQGCTLFGIKLHKVVAARQSGSIKVTVGFSRQLDPFPADIHQEDPQYVRYNGSAVFFSPYKSEKQNLVVKLGTTRIESFDRAQGFRQSGEDVTYETAAATDAFLWRPFSVHYENNYPFATFTKAIRDIEVSHWGNVAVEEHVTLKHTGARIKGGFSRADYQRPGHRAKSSFHSLTALLPASARDLYYRDQIGNVSTSHVRRQRDRVHFEVEPRFPMMGGWKTDFYFGYNMPARGFLKMSGDDSGLYVLNISFAPSFSSVPTDMLEVRVTLPEGAYDVQWATPFDVDEEVHETRVTYLDTFGRPMLILRKANVVAFHNQPLYVAYRFPAFYYLREPLLLMGGFFLFFVASMAYMRVELSISPRSAEGATSLRSRRQGRVGELINLLIEKHPLLVDVYEKKDAENFGKAGDALFGEIRSALDELMKTGDSQVAYHAQQLEEAQSQLRSSAKQFAQAPEDLDEVRGRYTTKLQEVQRLLLEFATL